MTGIEAEFVDDARFERGDDGFVPTTNDWDATVVVENDAVSVEVVVPTLHAATAEPVADVVADGWFDTFERRVGDANGVTFAADVTVDRVKRVAGDVVAELTFEPRDGNAADDALALVNYVEGTWFQGVIPGYDYVERVQAMRERAAQNADGTPL